MTVLGEDLLPDLMRLQECLAEIETSPMRQQQLVELLAASLCLRTGDEAMKIAEGFYKHLRQIIEQCQ